MLSMMHKLHRAFQRCLPRYHQSHLLRRRFLSDAASAPEDVSINKRLTHLERQGIEHSVKLKGVSEQM